METEANKRFGSFLDLLKEKLNRDMDTEDLKKMAWLMKDKLQHEFIPLSNCELPSNVVDYLENNMMRREVITVLKHVLKAMDYHTDLGTLNFYKFIEEHETEEDNLIGRDKDIRAIFDMLEDADCQGVWIHGIGGMGKTTLARTIGVRYKFNMNWNFISVDLKKVDNMVDMYRAILGHFSCSSRSGEESSLRANILHNINRIERRTCLLLDNFEDVYDVNTDGVNKFLASFLLEKFPNVKLMITSRTRIDTSTVSSSQVSGTSLMEYELNELDENAACKLLKLCCQPRVLREDQYHRVLAYYGGIPLALRLVVNSLRSLKDEQLIDREIQSLSQRQDNMQDCIEYAFEKLNSELKIVATLLTVFDTSAFEASDAAAVLDMPLEEVTVMLMYLCHCHVLNEIDSYPTDALIADADEAPTTSPELTYNFHPLLASWLRCKQIEMPSVIRDCQFRFCKRMFTKMRMACKEYYRDGPRCIQLLRNNSAMLKTCLIFAQSGRFDKDISLEDCFNIKTVSGIIMTDSERQELFDNSVDSFEGIPQKCLLFWRIQIAADCIDSGRLDMAESMFSTLLNEVIQADTGESNARVSGEFYCHYGRLLRRKRRFADAKESLNNALRLLRNCKPEDGQLISVIADVLNTFGNIYFDLEDYDKSFTFHQNAIDEIKKIKRRDEGKVPYEISTYIFNIGVIAFAKACQIQKSEDPERKQNAKYYYKICIEQYDESLQIDRSLNVNELPKYAEKLQIRGKVRVRVKDFEGALSDVKEALRIICKTYDGVHSKVTIAKYNIGKVYLDWYRYMNKIKSNSDGERRHVLTMAKDEFNSAVKDINEGGLSLNDRDSPGFLEDLQAMAECTMEKKYIEDVKCFCLEFQRKHRFDAETDADSEDTDSSVEIPDTPEHSPEPNDESAEVYSEAEDLDMSEENGVADSRTLDCKRKKDSDTE